MQVVKIGGSLATDPVLPHWLRLLASPHREPIVIVPGGGAFADCVRDHQRRWRFGDAAAHRMAVLAMAQFGVMMAAIEPSLAVASSVTSLAKLERNRATTVWLPLDLVPGVDGIDESWDLTSDSLAAWLARELDASRLIVVKSCSVPSDATIDMLGDAGIVDRRFGALVAGASVDVAVAAKDESERVRRLLDGG